MARRNSASYWPAYRADSFSIGLSFNRRVASEVDDNHEAGVPADPIFTIAIVMLSCFG
jgi:hypothetical protein